MWMIPIYSLSSWLGLVFVQAQGFLSLFKDIYEAYVIYTFLSLLIAILARGDREAVITVLAEHADHLKPPMQFPWERAAIFHTPRQKAEAVLDQCQFFSMQFVLLRPITTIAIIVSDEFHETRWDPSSPQLYINIVTNISIFFAFTGLLRFYHAVKDSLNWCHPFSKFLSIKGVGMYYCIVTISISMSMGSCTRMHHTIPDNICSFTSLPHHTSIHDLLAKRRHQSHRARCI